ncbi:MAG: glycosyltransferase family 4 protein [bacterium]
MSSSLVNDRQLQIIICAVQVPFITGGAEKHIESLRRELENRDYMVDIVKLPFQWHPVRQLINGAVTWRLLDLTMFCGLPVDLVICTRFPTYCVKHPKKVAWVLHQHRQAYDFLNTVYTDFKDAPDDDEVRKLLYEIDSRSLKECTNIFANSRNVANRLERYLNIKSDPLYHPPPLTGRYRNLEYGNYVFTASRLELNKRIDLLLKALSLTKNKIHAVIAGKGPLAASLKKMADDLEIEERVKFVGYISDQEIIDHYGRCGVVWYAPVDEDYGYVTLEAFLSEKPVVTSKDAGGVLEFVEDGLTGYIGEPDPQQMALQLDRWYDNRQDSLAMGRAGKLKAEQITWDNVIKKLTASLKTNRKIANFKKNDSCET